MDPRPETPTTRLDADHLPDADLVLDQVSQPYARNVADVNVADLNTILQSISDAVLVTDARGKVTLLNPVAEQLTGWTNADAWANDSKVVFDIVNETSRKVAESPVDRVLQEGTRVRLANRTVLRRRDGSSEIYIDDSSSSGSPVRDAQGTLAGVVLVFRDGTERRREQAALLDTEAQLRDTQSRLDAAMLAGEIATWTFDIANDRVIVDSNLARLFSVDLATASGGELEVYLAAIHPEDRDRVSHSIGDAIRSGDRYEAEYRVVMPDGSARWLIARGSVERDETGRPVSLPGVVVDVTRAKEAESVRQQSEDQFRALFNSMSQGVVFRDPVTQVITSANSAAEQILGLTVAQMQGRVVADPRWRAVREDGTAMPVEEYPFSRALATGQPVRGFVQGAFNPQRNEMRWMRVDAVLQFRPGEDKPYRIYSLFEDITEQRNLQQEQERLYAQAHARAEREALLSEASRVLNASLDYQETLTAVARLIVPRFADWCAVDVVDMAAGDPQRVAVEHVDPEKAAWGWELDRRYPTRMEDERGIAAVLRTGESSFAPHVSDQMLEAAIPDQERLRLMRELGFTSVMIVPMAVRETVFGAISFLATRESGRTFTEEDLEFAKVIGQRAAFAVENARLYRTAQEASERQQFLSDLTERARRLDDPSDVIEETARSVGEFLHLSRYVYAEISETTDTIIVRHDWIDPTQDVVSIQGSWDFETWIRDVAPLGVTRSELRLGQVGIIRDFAVDARTSQEFSNLAPSLAKTRVRAVVRIPLYRDGQWVAILSAQCLAPRDWSAEDVVLLETIAERTWLTLENLRLLREAQEKEEEQRSRAERESLLNKIGAAVRASLEPEAILWAAVTALGQGLGADRCYFVRYNQVRDIARVSPEWIRSGLDIKSIAEQNLQMSSFSVDRDESYKAGATHVVDDAVAYAPQEADSLLAVNIRALLRVPIEVGDQMTALAVSMAYEPRHWSDEEIRLVENVAALLHSALESALAQQRERNIAQTLQDALQPAPPAAMPGLALSSYYRSALQESSVGGDFFDVFEVEEGCTALVVADLSGKGLQAAAQVSTVRNMLRFALYSKQTLSDAISALHRILVENELLTGFATLFVALHDNREKTLTYVNCGQEDALIWRALSSSGEVEQLPPTGPVLGGFIGGKHSVAKVDLSPGDIFFAGTDGMTEVGPSRKQFLEIKGLADLFGRCAVQACAESQGTTSVETPKRVADLVVGKLIAGVEEYAGSAASLRDDIAMLVGVVTV